MFESQEKEAGKSVGILNKAILITFSHLKFLIKVQLKNTITTELLVQAPLN